MAWPKEAIRMDEMERRNSRVGNAVNGVRDPGRDLPPMSSVFPHSGNPSTNQGDGINSPIKNQNKASYNLMPLKWSANLDQPSAERRISPPSLVLVGAEILA